ncbi:MAG: transcriptional regulator [Deltaproteobacteria bacterium RIFOXYD12_FULL_50_9]|nr:MAG: transcriptional regulator [Deltaproteobacteria bacterium RIFOXYD12_FULL_50_9]
MFELGQAIRQARKSKCLTQAQVAAAVGIGRVTISQMENETVQDIGIRKVIRLLEYLGLELAVRPAGAPPTLEELQKEQKQA